MKSPMLILAGCALLTAFLAGNRKVSYADLNRNTVMVENATGTGTGVVVTRENADGHRVTYVWTAAHVVQADVPITIGMLLGHGPIKLPPPSVDPSPIQVWIDGKAHLATVVDVSFAATNGIDVAVLRVWDNDVTSTSVSFAVGAPPAIGSFVQHVGYMHGTNLPASYSVGTVAGLNRHRGDNGTRLLDQVQLPVLPGSSGGGVFDREGQVVGLADMLVQPGTFALIVPAREIQKWAKSEGLDSLLP